MEAVISVIMPTRNRAMLLDEALASLGLQTVPRDQFEVVVIDDGSTDATPEICAKHARRLQLRTMRVAPSGIAAAKNLGIFAAGAPIVLFLDDDDVAHPDLLQQHLRSHESHPGNEMAVLGYTTWSSALTVTPLMHYVTDVGKFLFDYTWLTGDEVLDYRCFWGGRSSCKRAMLYEHGIFNPDFTFGCEDIELGYRLAAHGFKVTYNAEARSFMNRGIDFSSFCWRSERQGRAQHHFACRLHTGDPAIQAYCEVEEAAARWSEFGPRLAAMIAQVSALEQLVLTVDGPSEVREDLYALYGNCFRAFKAKGIVEAASRFENT